MTPPYNAISDLGSAAPPYIVIAIAIAMIGAVAAAVKQYQEDHVNVHRAMMFVGHIPVYIFLALFSVSSVALLFFSVIGIFLWPGIVLCVVSVIIKITLLFNACCFAYAAREFMKRYKEKAEEENP